MASGWSSELFNCFSDIPLCLFGTFCSCCVYGKIAEKVDGSPCLLYGAFYCLAQGCGLCCLLHGGLRQNLRARFNLEPDFNDYLITCVCPHCSICQEARELQFRGEAAEGFFPVSQQPRS